MIIHSSFVGPPLFAGPLSFCAKAIPIKKDLKARLPWSFVSITGFKAPSSVCVCGVGLPPLLVGLSLCVCWASLPVLYANLSVCFVYWPVRQECCRQTFSSLRLQYHHFTMGNKSWNLKSYQKSSQLQPLVNWIVHPLHHLSSNRSIIHRGEKLPLPIWVLSISTLKRSKAWKAEKIQRAKAWKAWKVQQRKRFESFSVLQLPGTYKHQLLNSIWSTQFPTGLIYVSVKYTSLKSNSEHDINSVLDIINNK